MTKPSSRRAATLVLAAAIAGMLTAAPAHGAAALGVSVRPATPGTLAAPVPVALGIRASLAADARGALPPTLRRLTIGLPDGFATALEGTVPCAREDLALRGPAACPAGSRLGAGSASFVYVAGLIRIAATTEELTLLRGNGDGVLLYLRVTQPTTVAYVLPGTLTAGAIAVDLSEVAQSPSGYAVVRSFGLDLARGVAAGSCPAGAWTFTGHFEFAGGGAEAHAAPSACDGSGTAPDVTAPRLSVTARPGAAAGGARLALRLSEPARVVVTLERLTARGRPQRLARASFERAAGAGRIVIRRTAGRRLPAGRYRARLRAIDGAGLLSPKRTVAFRLR